MKETYMHFTNERDQSGKATFCMIPFTWHSRKGKTIETVKWSGIAWDWGKGERNRESSEDFQGCKSTQYDTITVDKHSYIGPDSYNVQNQQWTVLWTMAFGWLCCITVGSPVVSHWTLWRGSWRGRLCMWGDRRHVGNLCSFPSLFLWT